MTTTTVTSSNTRSPISPLALLATFTTHRDLIWQMAKRNVVGRYKGSILGLFWSFFHPLLMLSVYTLAFSFIFEVRIPRFNPSAAPEAAGAVHLDFAFHCFAGMIVYTLFAEVLAAAPSIILANTNYVKKVVFPLEVFPFVLTGAALIHMSMSLLVLLIGFTATQHVAYLSWLLLPVVILPLLLLTLGLGWLLASLGVYIRDVAQTIGVILMILMYLSPVFYTIQQIKNPVISTLILLNPLTIPIENTRNVLLMGAMPNWQLFFIHAAVSLVICWLGYAFFQRTKRGFADVL